MEVQYIFDPLWWLPSSFSIYGWATQNQCLLHIYRRLSLKKKKSKLHWEIYTVASKEGPRASAWNLIQGTITRNWHTNMVIHPNVNRDQWCLTGLCLQLTCITISKPITTVMVCKLEMIRNTFKSSFARIMGDFWAIMLRLHWSAIRRVETYEPFLSK